VTKDYTASLTATVTTSAANAALSVQDRSASAPGHLTQGAYVMPQALQVQAQGGAFAPLAATPMALLAYSGPKSLDAVTIGFKQHVEATDGLHAGVYGKTLTFSPAATTP
jgi:hypothetical protein